MSLRRLGSFALVLGVGLFAGTARADIVLLGSFSGSGTDKLTGADGSGSSGLTSTVSAKVDFSYNTATSQLLMALTNTTAQNQLIGNDDALTQMAFKLSGGLTLSAGSASGFTASFTSPPPGTGTFTPSASSVDLSAQWGGGRLVGSGAPAEFTLLSGAGDNYAVTSLTDELLTTGNVSYKNFNGTNLDNTTKYGLIPTVSSPQRSDNFIGNTPYGWGTVNIAFTVSGPVTIDQISGVNFIFGASDPPNAIVAGIPTITSSTAAPVPVPAAAWTGLSTLLGLGGLGILRRRRRA